MNNKKLEEAKRTLREEIRAIGCGFVEKLGRAAVVELIDGQTTRASYIIAIWKD